MSPRKSSQLRKYLEVELKDALLLLFGLLVLFGLVKYIGTENILPAIARMDLKYLALLLALVPLYHMIWNYKWKLLVDELFKVRLAALVPIYFTGIFVNNLTPGHNVGGEPVRAYFLSKETRKPFSECLATAVMDIGIHSLVFLMFSVFAIAYVLVFLDVPSIRYFLLGFLVFTALLVIMVFHKLRTRKKKRGPSKWMDRFLRWIYGLKIVRRKFKSYEDFRGRIFKVFTRFVKSIKGLLVRKRMLAKIVFLALIVLILEYLQLYVIFLGLGEQVPFFKIVVVMAISSLISYFTILPGGTGVVEAAMIAVLTAMGISIGTAAAAALIQRSIFYFVSYGVGMVSLNYLGLRHRENVNLT